MNTTDTNNTKEPKQIGYDLKELAELDTEFINSEYYTTMILHFEDTHNEEYNKVLAKNNITEFIKPIVIAGLTEYAVLEDLISTKDFNQPLVATNIRSTNNTRSITLMVQLLNQSIKTIK
jgi:hypothetical protein